jgi:hypothetical protein
LRQEQPLPKCLAALDELGDLKVFAPRNHMQMAALFEWMADHPGIIPARFEQDGLRPAYQPFWADLPHYDVPQSLTPDLLHQLHNGLISEYIVPWYQKLADPGELDRRLDITPTQPGLRHFPKSISHISQWSGRESKEVEKQFVGTLPGAVPPRAVRCATAAMDFVTLASFQSHTDITLAKLEGALETFHDTKDVFLQLRDTFNIPKIHSMLRYAFMIRLFSSADGYSTEAPERLHIDFTKESYRASNKRDFTIQMTVHLRRKESLRKFAGFLAWRQLPGVNARMNSDIGDSTDSRDSDAADSAPEPEVKLAECTALRSSTSKHPRSQPAQPIQRGFLIAKHCPNAGMRLVDVQRRHHAPRLTHALQQFLRTSNPISL